MMSNSSSGKPRGSVPAKTPRRLGVPSRTTSSQSQDDPSPDRSAGFTQRHRRQRFPRWLSLAMAGTLAAAAAFAWWAATRPAGPPSGRVPPVTSIPFSATGDAYVSSVRPSVILGSSPVLRIASRPKIRSYLAFSLSGISGSVTAATLRLWSDTADLRGAAVHAVDGRWDEASLTYSTAPAFGKAVALTGVVAAKAWISVDVTPLVTGDGLVTMVLTQVGSGSGQYDSREGVHPPELVVKTSASPGSRTLPVTSPAAALGAAIQAVPDAPARRYGTRDDHGRSMDTLKIISKPGGGYLGVYHNGPKGVFQVYVAESRDLLHWTAEARLDSDASQPTIAALPHSGYLVADEVSANRAAKTRPHLRFRYYAGLADLLSAHADRTFEAPHTLTPGNAGDEGTPNIFSAVLSPDLAHSRITVGFHYSNPHRLDRPGIGILTNFSSWSAHPDAALEAALHAAGVTGRIGDRDAVTFLGAPLELVEAQPNGGPAWQIYLYNQRTHRASAMHIRTDQHSHSFGNPTVTDLRGPSGAPALVFTLFLPSSPAHGGEAGELVYFRTYRTAKPAGNPP
jgi:hypothetical protein